MSAIVLSTLNARYIHSALGLRYLMANMGELQRDTQLLEFNIDTRPIDIVERLLGHQPTIIGFGVYIWNVAQTTEVVGLIKRLAPHVTVVLGGPEVSYEWEQQEIVGHADFLVTGAADKSFARLCRRILARDRPPTKIIESPMVPVTELALPYGLYTDEDIANRIIYVEASRGCPFKCEFCLSALDKTAWAFDLDGFLQQMQRLHERGARHFKFVDRTFNLKVDTSIRILEFFLQRMDEPLFLHFELIPDHLPEKLKTVIKKFPAGSLQFEIGIQSFNPAVQTLISRKQNNTKSEDNLRWVRNASNAHIHADLIAGLPGEDMESFARGFNRLVELNPHEIQVGILKRLRGTPIIRHTDEFKLTYNPFPPYNVLCTDRIDFTTMQRLTRFARYWDMVANSGRFTSTKAVILADNPFERFMALSDWLFDVTGQTHKIALPRLFELLYEGLKACLAADTDSALQALLNDYQTSGLKGHPRFAPDRLQRGQEIKGGTDTSKIAQRQARHAKGP